MRQYPDRIWPVRHRLGLIITLAVLVTAGLGCKSPDFIGKRYNNFTAYYNTFYNAERQFETGVNNLDRLNVDVDRERYLPLFVKTTGASASAEFEETVLKSADLLREHPESKWIDDALLLIGKSYFYQENYVGATQKFREVIDLESSLEEEGRFWLARALITSGALDLAEEELALASNQENVNRRWASQYELLLAEMSIKQDNWEAAAGYLRSAIPDVKDKEIAGRAQFLLGQVTEKLGRYEEAHQAYEDVRRYRPSYELGYAARYSAVRVEGTHLDPERALVEVRKMERDDKNFTSLSELRYLRARILQSVGRDDESYDIYYELLYDPVTSLTVGKVKGRIHYALGEMYRDIDHDYVMAAAYFDTASASLNTAVAARNSSRVGSAPGTDLRYAPEAIVDARDLKDSYSAFSRVYRDIARYDSLLWLGMMPQEEYDAKIIELRQLRAEELAEQRRILEERQREQAFRNANSTSNDPFLNRGLPEGKIIPTPGDPTGQQGGYLFNEDPIRVQEGRLAFQNIWGTRPLVPNWRRSAALNASDAETDEAAIEEAQEVLQQLTQNELPDINDSAVPRDSLAQLEMRSSRANSRYELGNILFLGMASPDSAAVWYRQVIDEDPSEAVAQRAFYALAEVHRALGDSLAANRLYRDILDRFPDSDFSNGVRERLGIEDDDIVLTDSLLLAIEAFENIILDTEADSVARMNDLLGVAVDWTGFDESPRALLAAGDIHLRMAGADSAAIFAALPLTIERHRLSGLWPNKFQPLPDTSAVEADSLFALPDSTGSIEEGLSVSPDSMAAVPADSTLLSSELVNLPSDSGIAPPDSVLVPAGVDGSSEQGGEQENESEAAADSSQVSTILETEDLAAAASDSTGGPVSEPGAVADTTSALDSGVLKDSIIASMTPPVEAVTSEPEPADLFIEDIYSKIVSLSRGEKVALQAQAILDALVEYRTPPPDTTATDSLATDTLAVTSALPDSVVLAMVARSAATQDSLAARADSLARQGITRDVPRAGAPGAIAEGGEEDDSREEEGEEARSSSNLKPLLPTGRPDLDAEGYSVILATHFDLQSAQLGLRELSARIDSTGIPLYVITQSVGDQLEFLIGWGMFSTRAEGDDAQVRFDAYLPERRNYLHLLPTTVRRR